MNSISKFFNELPTGVYTCFIIGFTLIATLIPFFSNNKLYDRRHNFFKQPHKNIYWLLGFSILAAFFTFLKDDDVDYKTNQVEKRNIKVTDSLRNLSDSLASAKIKEGTDRTVVTFTHALGEYGLKLTKENEIIKAKIEDAKNATPDPELFVSDIQEQASLSDSLILKVFFESNHQTAYHAKINFMLIVESENHKLYSYPQTSLMDDSQITYLAGSSSRFRYAGVGNLSMCFIIMKGSYYNKKNVEIPFQEIKFYNRKEKVFGSLYNKPEKRIKDFAISKGFIFD